MSDDLFTSPYSVHRWACEEIEHFQSALQAFAAFNKPAPFKQLDILTGMMVFGYTVPDELPDELWKRSYHAVGSLRNALDQAMHAASLRLDTDSPTKTNFPVANEPGPEGVLKRLKAPSHAGIPKELHDCICSFHPYWKEKAYPDGDDILRSLLEIANPNKHRVAIQATIRTGLAIRAISNVPVFQRRQFSKNKVELFRVPVDHQFTVDMDVVGDLAFAEGSRIKGAYMVEVLWEMSRRVVNAIVALDRESRRLSVAD